MYYWVLINVILNGLSEANNQWATHQEVTTRTQGMANGGERECEKVFLCVRARLESGKVAEHLYWAQRAEGRFSSIHDPGEDKNSVIRASIHHPYCLHHRGINIVLLADRARIFAVLDSVEGCLEYGSYQNQFLHFCVLRQLQNVGTRTPRTVIGRLSIRRG